MLVSIGSSSWRTLNLSIRTFKGRWIGAMTYDPTPLCSLPEKWKKNLFLTKVIAYSASLYIKIPLHYWRPLFHITHIECTSSSRSETKYICSLRLCKQVIDWDFIFELKPSIKYIINLEVKNSTKFLISTEVWIFVTYPFERVFVILRWNLNCVLFWLCLFYNIIVNAFYFHNYSYKFKKMNYD